MPSQSESYPVEQIPTDPEDDRPEPGLGLCLSGGGYRAMLFHLGSLWRLNELAYLPRLARISSVSGGSIVAGVLGLAWSRLEFAEGRARRFDDHVVQPLRHFADQTIDSPAIVRGLFGFGSVGDRVAGAYRQHLFGDRTLQDLPGDDGPRFVINAANLQSGALWRFSRPYARDYRVGEIRQPSFEVAVAVAASSAFPPFLSPVVLRPEESTFTPDSGLDLQHRPFTTSVHLTDGGVYDNLGLETVWKRYATVLVSDGGGKMAPVGAPKRDWGRQARRVLDIVDNQVRSLRKRQLIASYQAPAGRAGHRTGAYWGIRSDIANYHLGDALPCPVQQTSRLADMPTRLRRMDARTQEQLVNWGYAVCDAAMRKHVDPSLPAPGGFPYPGAGVG